MAVPILISLGIIVATLCILGAGAALGLNYPGANTTTDSALALLKVSEYFLSP